MSVNSKLSQSLDYVGRTNHPRRYRAMPAGLGVKGFGGLKLLRWSSLVWEQVVQANDLCAEQYQNEPVLKTLKSGERVVDSELTVQRLLCGSTGSSMLALSPLITVNVEANTPSGLHIWSHWCKLSKAHNWVLLTSSSAILLLCYRGSLSGPEALICCDSSPKGLLSLMHARSCTLPDREKCFEDAKPSALEASGRLQKYPFALPRYNGPRLLTSAEALEAAE